MNSKKWSNIAIFDQNVIFLTTYGQKIKNLASSVKFLDNFNAFKLLKWLKDIREHRKK